MSPHRLPVLGTALVVAGLVLMAFGAAVGPELGAGPGQAAPRDLGPGAPPHITVTLGIYSGREDPSWDLRDDQAAELVAHIEALPAAAGTPPQGGLGYHGFVLVIRRAGQADQTLVAYHGTVAEPGAAPRPYRSDRGRTIERSLLDVGRSRLAATEIAAVEADLAAK